MSDKGEGAGEMEPARGSGARAPSQAPASAPPAPRRHPKMLRQASPPMRRASAPDSNARRLEQHPLDVAASDPQKFTRRFMETGSLFRQRQNVRLEDGRHATSPASGEKASSMSTFQDRGQRYNNHGQDCTDHENNCSDYIQQQHNCDLVHT